MPDRPISEHVDDALLAQLAAAMAPEDARPPASTIAALHAAVAARGVTVAPERRLVVWIHRKWAVAVAAVALLTLGTGTAFAAGVPVPPPIRVLATDIGLPVTPQPVVDVRNATTSLQQQLRATPTNPVGTALAAGHLAKLIKALPASQQPSVPAIAPQLLHQACQQAFPTTGGQAVRSPARTGPTAPTGWAGCPAVTGAGGPGVATATRPTTSKAGTTTPTGPTTSPGGHPSSGGSGWPTTTVSGGSAQPGQPTTPTTWPGHGSAGGSGAGPGHGTGSSSDEGQGPGNPSRGQSSGPSGASTPATSAGGRQPSVAAADEIDAGQSPHSGGHAASPDGRQSGY